MYSKDIGTRSSKHTHLNNESEFLAMGESYMGESYKAKWAQTCGLTLGATVIWAEACGLGLRATVSWGQTCRVGFNATISWAPTCGLGLRATWQLVLKRVG
eukprot:40243-Amorphochlora_amoeboformis.AAC.2